MRVDPTAAGSATAGADPRGAGPRADGPQVDGPTVASGDVRLTMRHEARAVIDAARAEGLTLRLLGGLAVREHCRDPELCARDYSDLDMVAPAAEARRLPRLLARFGYTEDYDVAGRPATASCSSCAPAGTAPARAGPPHADDHIDVFLGTFRMDHQLALGDRLHLAPYTLAPADLLLTKLQVFRLTGKDVRDIVTLLDALEVDAATGSIDAAAIARRCADDWGLFHDVATNLQRVGELLPEFALDDAREAHVRRGLARLIGALDDAPKSLSFKLRAKIGARAPWHNAVDDQD